MKQINICITLPDHTLLDEFFVISAKDMQSIPDDSTDYESVEEYYELSLVNRIKKALAFAQNQS